MGHKVLGHDRLLGVRPQEVTEETVAGLDDFWGRAEIIGHDNVRSARMYDVITDNTEDRDIGTAESVDGLLGITDDKKVLPPQLTSCRPRKQVNQFFLLLIRILELVDHDVVKTMLVGPADFGIIPQKRDRPSCKERETKNFLTQGFFFETVRKAVQQAIPRFGIRNGHFIACVTLKFD